MNLDGLKENKKNFTKINENFKLLIVIKENFKDFGVLNDTDKLINERIEQVY